MKILAIFMKLEFLSITLLSANGIIIVVTVEINFLPLGLKSGKAGLFLQCIKSHFFVGSQTLRLVTLICHFLVSVVFVHVPQKCTQLVFSVFVFCP